MQQNPPAVSPLAKYKLVFLGDQSVGKTSIINRFIYNAFDGKDHPTVGIDFISKTLHIDDRSIRLQLWDTAGQERFRSLIPSYIRDSSVAVIVYDITNRKSFENVKRWVDDVHAQRGSDVLIVIVGNKSEMEEDRAVRKEDGEVKAKSFDANFIEVSAKSGDNIISLFKIIASTLPGTENSQMVSMSGRVSTTQGQNAGPVSNQNEKPSNIQLNPSTVNEAEQKKTQQSNSQGCC